MGIQIQMCIRDRYRHGGPRVKRVRKAREGGVTLGKPEYI